MTDQAMASHDSARLSLAEKIAVVINGATGTFHNQMIQLFLLFFYTDVLGVSAKFASLLFLVARVIDAFLGPAFGIFVDRTRTPWGKYKPWYILTGALIGVFGWLSFTRPPLTGSLLLAYVALTYFMYSGLKPMEQAPANALLSTTTKSLQDRLAMNQVGFVLIMAAAILAQVAVPVLYPRLGGSPSQGFFIIMGVAAIIGLVVAVFQLVTIQERYANTHTTDSRVPLREMVKIVLTNRYVLIPYMFVFAINLSAGMRSALTIYLFRYYFHSTELMAVAGAAGFLPILLGVGLSRWVTNTLGVRGNLVLATLVGAITNALVLLMPPSPTGAWIYIGITAVAGLFQGISIPAQGTMLPAAMDYVEWSTGRQLQGFLGSLYGFFQTLANALASAMAAASLSIIGYVPNTAQSRSTLMGLLLAIGVVPAIFTLLQMSVIWFDLSESRQSEIEMELRQRRQGSALEPKPTIQL